jgi:hypothetical protein
MVRSRTITLLLAVASAFVRAPRPPRPSIASEARTTPVRTTLPPAIFPRLDWLIRLACCAALASSPAVASELAVVGVPHMEQLEPVATDAQTRSVVDALAAWRPSRVCIEAIPGDRIAGFARDPARYGELLGAFARTAVALAPEQQWRRRHDDDAARDAARALVLQQAPLTRDQTLQLVSLHLAAYEPWSAALVWSALTEDERGSAREILGIAAVDRLEGLVGSRNEIARLAIPLARQLGHRDLCHADPIVDELAVAQLADALQPLLLAPEVGAGLAAFEELNASRWNPSGGDALLDLLAWMQTEDWAMADRRAQWQVFSGSDEDHHAGKRRLALWHARNAEIVTALHRASAREDGARVLMLVGAAHRPFLEAAVAAQPYVSLVRAIELLPAAASH